MRPFRFRAEAALEVRRRQDEAARRALGTARIARLDAARAAEEAGEAVADADRRGVAVLREARSIDAIVWQGNWMSGLERNVARARQVLEERRIDERRAAEIAQHARMQVRVLEKLKERAWRTWQLETRRAEQKALDELAGLRFAARQRAAEE